MVRDGAADDRIGEPSQVVVDRDDALGHLDAVGKGDVAGVAVDGRVDDEPRRESGVDGADVADDVPRVGDGSAYRDVGANGSHAGEPDVSGNGRVKQREPMRQDAGVQIGEIRVDGVMDGMARTPPSDAFRWGAGDEPGAAGRGLDDADWEPHRQFIAADGMLEMALGAFLVRAAGRLVLVDAGIGVFDRGVFKGGAMLDNLRALGVGTDDITDVVFTHLHFDHTGWATVDGVPVFRNATYRCDADDWSFFVPGDERATRKLAPIEDRLQTWDHDGPLLPGIDVRRAPGHTPGSTILVLSSGDQRAMLLGDVVHCPVELLDDEWASIGDVDPTLAKQTRIALARELEGDDVPVAAAHFPGLEFGRLLVGEGRRSWVV